MTSWWSANEEYEDEPINEEEEIKAEPQEPEEVTMSEEATISEYVPEVPES